MSKFKLTDELLSEVQEKVFGPCTVVYEAMTLEEIKQDIADYLTRNKVFMVGEKRAIYTPSLTITTFKSWLLVRMQVELYDVNPETPFDRTDAQIERAKKSEERLKKRLTTNINQFILKLRYDNRPESGAK